MNLIKINIRKYFINCFLLLIPIFIWNIAFINSLPKAYDPRVFWKDIPAIVGYGENVLRVFVFGLPVIMILSLKTKRQKMGLTIFSVGIILYFLSWIFQIYYPQSAWSQSVFGFTAPAYTTIIWFVGIGLIGQNAFVRIPNTSSIYIVISIIFVIFHTLHAYMVFQRL